jgi:hypothetical protein
MWFTSRTNLHTTWDSKIIQRWKTNLNDAVTELASIMQKNQSLVNYFVSTLDPNIMAADSFEFVLDTVYDYEMKNGCKRFWCVWCLCVCVCMCIVCVCICICVCVCDCFCLFVCLFIRETHIILVLFVWLL